MFRLRTQHDPLRPQPLANQGGDVVETRQPRCRVKFQDQRRVVAVQDQPRPAVVFTMNQPAAGRLVVEQAAPAFEGLVEPSGPPACVNRLRPARLERAQPDRRVRVEQSQGQKAVLTIVDYRQLAGLSGTALPPNGLREDPGVAGAQRRLRRRSHPQLQTRRRLPERFVSHRCMVQRGVASGRPPSTGMQAPVVGVWRRAKNMTALATCSAVTLAFSRLRLR